MRAGLKRIPVAGPWITQKEVDYVADAAANAWYANANLWHERFERAFAEHLDLPHALALPSCTSAIHLALAGLGIGPGDEVVVPDCTWIASAAPISYVGATPVFADIDETTWCLSARTLQDCLSPRTRAVIVVDLYGNMPAMEPLLALARGLAVIEDAAESVGAEQGGRPAGAFGDAGVFSFHGSKTLTTGEGGLLATARDDLHRRALVLRDHGRQPGDTMFVNGEVAWKYKLSALQAALGLAQLERLPELMQRKRAIMGWYREELGGCDGLVLNRDVPGTRASYWMVTAIVDARLGLTKQALMARLAEDGIDTRPFFHPLSSLPAYRDLPQSAAARERNRTAYSLSPRGLNLPSALSLTREDVQRVGDALRRALKRA
jgi:perosamine synthetase